MFSWIAAVIVSASLCVGFAGGTWMGAKLLSEKIKYEDASYKDKNGLIVSGKAIITKQGTYYHSGFINQWLKDRAEGKSQLKDL